MIDPYLSDALGRLDAWLVEVCAREERRAQRLASEAGGWKAVQAMARPTAAELAFDEAPSAALLPAGEHPLRAAVDVFGLSDAEGEALLVLASPHLEPRYRSLYAVLQDDLHQRWCTERLLLTVLGRTPERRRALTFGLSDAGRLTSAGLVVAQAGAHAPLDRGLDLAPDVRGALLGQPLPTSLGGAAFERALHALDSDDLKGAPSFAVVFGAGDVLERVGELARGAAIHRLGALDDRAAALGAAEAAWRLGALAGFVPWIDLTALESGADVAVASALKRRVDALGGRVIVRARDALALPVLQLEARTPSFSARRATWRDEAERRRVALDDDATARLASTFRFGPAETRAVFDAAEPNEASLREVATRLVHVPVRHASPAPATRTFADLVVRDSTRAALERLVHYATHRDRLAEERGLEDRFRLKRGPLVLFSGLSGTGKTLAAEVVANALGRRLAIVDLSRLVSKYIGETEKHIAEVLTDAERAGVVLFFDEADALFSQRTEVTSSNDRYANLEVGYLLQRVERHDGVVILATNLRQSIDEAFLRRFQFRVEFPFPEPEERRGIWERMLPAGVPKCDSLDLAPVARAYRLSGGDIANAALRAIFLAAGDGAPLTNAHLERSIALELLELGRLSRQPATTEEPPDRGRLLKAFVEALATPLEDHLKKRFLKEVHLVHGAPTREALAGKRPAVSLALYRMSAQRSGALRIGFIASAWSSRAEEEHELLGVVHEALSNLVLGPVAGLKATMRVQESFDFELIHRFWSSHGHPVKASVVVEGEVG